MAEQRGGKGWWPPQMSPLQGQQFRSKMYYYYTNRGAHIYFAPGCNTPYSVTVKNSVFVKITSLLVIVAHIVAAGFLSPHLSSLVEPLLMMQWADGSIPHGGPIGLFLIPANAP